MAQLESVTTNGTTVSYVYNGFGQRVKRTQGSAVTWSIYDSDDLLLELDGSANVLREYTMYPGVDAPHSLRAWSGSTPGSANYYVLEQPGHVTGLVNSSSQVANQYRYTPWGQPESTSETVAQPLRFMAREYDGTTGLYYVRARWYDPMLGRFNSEDPIGREGGVNQYAYVGNSPTNGRDPSGEDPTIAKCIKSMVNEYHMSLRMAEASCGLRPIELMTLNVTVTWPFSTPRNHGESLFVGNRGPNVFAGSFLYSSGGKVCPGGFSERQCDMIARDLTKMRNHADPFCRQLGVSETQRFVGGRMLSDPSNLKKYGHSHSDPAWLLRHAFHGRNEPGNTIAHEGAHLMGYGIPEYNHYQAWEIGDRCGGPN